MAAFGLISILNLVAMTNQRHQPTKLISLILFYNGKIKLSISQFTETDGLQNWFIKLLQF